MHFFRRSFSTTDVIIFVVFLAIVFTASLLVNSFDLRMRAFISVPANILVDVSTTAPLPDNRAYHAFAQGGEEQGDMLAPVLPLVKRLQPALIRLDHIYDGYDIVHRAGTELTFDWTRLDEAVRTITAAGATPVLALSYMPTDIAREGSLINPPTQWGEWEHVVQKTVEHVSGTLGLSGVYYEVWNEPDLGQFGSWKTYGDKNYLTLYTTAVRGASRARGVKQFSIGGPATTGLYKAWIERLLETGARIDFLSWHYYDPSPEKFKEEILSMESWGESYARIRSIPLLVTEAGFTGAKHTLYESSYAAAYTAALYRQSLDLPNRPVIFTFQLKDGPNQSDGWGLIGHERSGSVLKPRYHVFALMDRMSGSRVSVVGEGTWVAAYGTQDGDVTKVLLSNMDPFTPGKSHTETVPITFTHIADGSYTITTRYLAGNVKTETKQSTGDTISTDVILPGNQVAVVELAPSN